MTKKYVQLKDKLEYEGIGLCQGVWKYFFLVFLHYYFNTQYFNCSSILKIICCQHLVKICFTECTFAVSKFSFYSKYVVQQGVSVQTKKYIFGNPTLRSNEVAKVQIGFQYFCATHNISCLVAYHYFNFNYQVLQVFKYLKLVAAFFH